MIGLDEMGVFGHKGEFKPRYGLWIDTSPECQAAIDGLLKDGFDCDVVLKYGARCPKHTATFRPLVKLSEYQYKWRLGLLEDRICYIREAFFPDTVKVVRR